MSEQLINKTTSADLADEWPEETRTGPLRTLLRHRELIASLTYRDIRSRYKQSVLGIAWALLTPIAYTLVFTVIFSRILKVPTGGQPAAVFIYIVMVPWTFFVTGITAGSDCLISNFNLITKIYFPREVFPISAILGKLVDLGLGILVLIPLFFLYNIKLTWLILLSIPLLAVQTCFMLGISFVFSSVNLFYRDIKHLVPLLTHLWLYVTPVIYDISLVSSHPKIFPYYMILNPMAPIMASFRRVALFGEPPLWGYLGIATLISLATLVGGYALFKKLEPAFAETI